MVSGHHALAFVVISTGFGGAPRRPLAVALRAGRSAGPPRLVHRSDPHRRSARGAGVYDRMKLNGTLRGLLIIAAVAGVIVVLQLWTTLAVLVLLTRIAFFL